jgi:hypothetical protein
MLVSNIFIPQICRPQSDINLPEGIYSNNILPTNDRAIFNIRTSGSIEGRMPELSGNSYAFLTSGTYTLNYTI